MKEVAEKLHMDVNEVKSLVAISQNPVSFDEPVLEHEDSTSYGGFLENQEYEAPEEEPFNRSLREEINAVLRTLTTREAEVIQYRFGLNNSFLLSLAQIGTRYHLTKERIRQIEKKALDKLRRRPINQRLSSYLS